MARKKMPDNPNTLIRFFEGLPPWVAGAFMACVVAALRVVYDKEETSFIRIMLESLICACLTIAAGSAMNAMGFGPNWYLGAGGFIGFMGSQSIRALANKVISKRI